MMTLRAALELAICEIKEHNSEYHHRTSDLLLAEFQGALDADVAANETVDTDCDCFSMGPRNCLAHK